MPSSPVAVRPLDAAGPDDLSFLHNPKYAAQARASRAGAILARDAETLPGRVVLVCTEPYLALAKAIELLHPAEAAAPGVHPTAVVADDAVVGAGVSIGPYAVVGPGCRIGDRSVIGAGCVLGRRADVGEGCLLHARVVVEDGCLRVTAKGGGGDIVTVETFADFELSLQWKVAPGANSGIMYRVAEDQGAPWMTGPEYQILDDDQHADGKNEKTAAASLYALVAPQGKKLVASYFQPSLTVILDFFP